MMDYLCGSSSFGHLVQTAEVAHLAILPASTWVAAVTEQFSPRFTPFASARHLPVTLHYKDKFEHNPNGAHDVIVLK